jgi:hypothetical protein
VAELPSVLVDPPWRSTVVESVPSDAGALTPIPPCLRWFPGEREDVDTHPRSNLTEEADEALLDRLLDQLDRKQPPQMASVRRLSDARLAELAEELTPDVVDYGLLQLVLARVGDRFVTRAVELVLAAPPERGLFKAMVPVEASALAPVAAAELKRRRTHLDEAMTRPFSRLAGERWLERHAEAAARGLWASAHDEGAPEQAIALAGLKWIASRGIRTGVDEVDAELAPLLALGEVVADKGLEWVPVLVAAGLDRQAIALLADVDDPRVVPFVADAVTGSARADAVAWLEQHRDVASRALEGRSGPAIEILRGNTTAADPALLDFPETIPPLPEWLSLVDLPVPSAGGEPLPAQSVTALAEMLRFSSVVRPYAGVRQVRHACDAGSLDAFALALLRAWLDSGQAPRDRWTLEAVGLIGADACARELAGLIPGWSKAHDADSASSYAASACAMLAAMGTDLALTVLDDLARSGSQQWLRKLARDALGEVQEGQPLRREHIDDAPLPAVDLDPDGGATFDLVGRTVRLDFDEHIVPQLVDEGGTPLKAFPRQRKADDPERYQAAKERFAALRRDARVIAAQLPELELAMVHQRAWTAEAFVERFVEHPLMRQVALRLVWRTGQGELFGEPPALSPEAKVTIAHPVEMSAAERERFGGIAQPFPQLERDVFTVERDELDETELSRFVGSEAEAPRVAEARRRGWRSRDGGFEWVRVLPAGAEAFFRVDGEQRITAAWCSHTLGRLPAIDYSELVRDLTYVSSSG